MRQLLLVACIAVLGCATTPPTPTPGPNVAINCKQACDNLNALSCEEGLSRNCLDACTVAQGLLTNFDLACASTATTQEQARECRGIRCP